jgi:hypothetical protein
MGEFEVNIYYHGCFNVKVEANNEEEATDMAYRMAETMDEKEFLRKINIESEGHDVYQIK